MPRPPLDADEQHVEIVLGTWEIGEIDRELDVLQHRLEHVRAMRHPWLCLRIRRQVEELRVIREHTAHLDEG